MDTTSRWSRSRGGFTLVEMLAVIVIIGILAALITAAAIAARKSARQAAIKTEIDQLANALASYREAFGEYPPDFSNDAAVRQHLQNNFRKWPGASDSSNWSGQDEASSLVFWLGGRYDASSKLFLGYSGNPRNPFGPGPPSKGPFFQFDNTRLKDDNGVLYYYPKLGSAMGSSPFVYFKARSDGYGGKSWSHPNGGNTANPYTNGPDAWANPGKFQIICAGLDDKFGTETNFPTGPYDLDTYDNITNFTSLTLEGDMP